MNMNRRVLRGIDVMIYILICSYALNVFNILRVNHDAVLFWVNAVISISRNHTFSRYPCSQKSPSPRIGGT